MQLKMYKGMRLAVLSRILDSGAVLRPANFNGVTTLRCYSGTKKWENKSQQATNIIPFSQFIETRLSEASRSILVDVKTEKNLHQLFTICEKYGEIEKVFRYELSDGKQTILLEMKNGSFCELFERIAFDGPGGLPQMCSPFVKADFDSIIVMQTKFRSSLVEEICKSGGNGDSDSFGGKSILWSLYNNGKISDFNMRLRFLVISQLESAFRGLWKNARVIPFGGSVNGFGSSSSDLDMSIIFENLNNEGFISYRTETIPDLSERHNSCFKAVSIILKNFLPGCKYVTPIPGALVPIVKFYHTFVEVECDVALQSADGILSTEIMYYVSHLHSLVKPLAFVAKRWAKDMNLIQAHPGKTITNFGLLAMVIFFLQQKRGKFATLPPLSEIQLHDDIKNPFSDERYKAVVKIMSNGTAAVQNETLDELLYKFFSYYSKFNFKLNGLCIRTGKIVENKKHVPLLIVNPLNGSLNITKQVTEKEIEKIKVFCCNAKRLYENHKCFAKDLFDIKNYNYREKELSKSNIKKSNEDVIKKEAVTRV